MRVSINITNYAWPDGPAGLGAHLSRISRAADEGGLDTVWVGDHLIQGEPGFPPEGEVLEAYTTLGFLAAATKRVRLGTMVTGATFRPPSLLIKAVTAVDVLSGGRAWFGVGAGYHEEEARMMGLPLPPPAERFDRLTETLRLAVQMWLGDDAAFEGRYYQLARPLNSPNSVQRPRPPILIGGMGERRTLRLVAEYADACNLFDIPDGGRIVARKLDVLAKHCEEVGRPYADIEKTVSTRLQPGESPDAFAERCAALAALGFEHVVVITSGPWTDDAVARLATAARAVQETAPDRATQKGANL
jgi:F420-dependent oxidoreductase-like protein